MWYSLIRDQGILMFINYKRSMWIITTKTVESFINSVLIRNKSTAKEYKKRLKSFALFVDETYSITLDDLIKILLNAGKKSKKIDVYSLLSAYVSWLNKKNTKSPRSIKDWVSTSRHYCKDSTLRFHRKV